MNTEVKSMMVSVTGRVQGVGFREWTRREATRRGVVGWVRNERDGSVSALIEGAPEAVDAMLAAMNSGPLRARVDHLSAMPGAETEGQQFEITEPDF
ncbi:Acylphosphate phosphohydrolase, putative [Roseibacterium elongatum DSM 19469]|uniref:Acylphosphatase n=1 Tax=Roseicyclus elongatus DSM 19469 TaxID=1294273 RepID=W8RS66_9RHOB|nr:acylphosphatase [Roseibacterium elongatum]AHM03928.1 Acylphosphate phosphohydrolase, putative [Roseibacterium elongatum DSM 19469]